jgi:hypothetical protein
MTRAAFIRQRSSIAVLERGSEPPAALLEALRTELAVVEEELRALGVDS